MKHSVIKTRNTLTKQVVQDPQVKEIVSNHHSLTTSDYNGSTFIFYTDQGAFATGSKEYSEEEASEHSSTMVDILESHILKTFNCKSTEKQVTHGQLNYPKPLRTITFSNGCYIKSAVGGPYAQVWYGIPKNLNK